MGKYARINLVFPKDRGADLIFLRLPLVARSVNFETSGTVNRIKIALIAISVLSGKEPGKHRFSVENSSKIFSYVGPEAFRAIIWVKISAQKCDFESLEAPGPLDKRRIEPIFSISAGKNRVNIVFLPNFLQDNLPFPALVPRFLREFHVKLSPMRLLRCRFRDVPG